MEPMTLSFGVLLSYLNRAIAEMKDPRKASNATKYSLQDAVLAAFSVFFMQSESFLDYQRHQESHHGKSNAQSLFRVWQRFDTVGESEKEKSAWQICEQV